MVQRCMLLAEAWLGSTGTAFSTWEKVLAECSQHPEGGLGLEVQGNQQHGRHIIQRLAVTNVTVVQSIRCEYVA